MERWGETILGAIVAAVAIGFFAFAAAQAGQGSGGQGGYVLTAHFQRVDGIDVGSDVRISGVKVGVVQAVEMDPTTFSAKLTMSLDRTLFHFERCEGPNAPPEGCGVPDDSTARIASMGLLGGNYVMIEPGSGNALAQNGEISNTAGAVDLLTLFASFAQGNNNQSQSSTSGETTP